MGWEWELNFSLSLSLARSLRNNFNAEAAIFKWKSTKKSYFTLQRIRKSNWKTINCGIASFQAIVCGNTSGTTVISFACFFPFSCRFALQMLRLYWTPGQIHFKKPWWWRRKRVKAKRRKKKTVDAIKSKTSAQFLIGSILKSLNLNILSDVCTSRSWVSCFCLSISLISFQMADKERERESEKREQTPNWPAHSFETFENEHVDSE